MDWKDIIVIIIAGLLAGIFAPKVTPPIVRWLKKKGILTDSAEENHGLNKNGRCVSVSAMAYCVAYA